MDKLLEFLKNRFKIVLGVAIPVILSTTLVSYLPSKLGTDGQTLVSYLSSKLGTDDQTFLFWFVMGLICFAVIAALFLLFFFVNKKRKRLMNAEYGSMRSELKAIFRKLKRKNFKNIPLILFTSTGESNGDELFSRADLNLLQLNKKEDSGFSVWYSPKFIVLDVVPEIFDIASASSPLNKKLGDLLRFLRKVRRRAPINSYVISLPFSYFSHTNHSDLKNNAKNIAKKLEYVQRILRIRFPAYLLIDRADMVHGFYDYATILGEGGSKQMVGWSSELKIKEILNEKNINNYFEEFSNDIYKPLYKKQSLTGSSGISSFCFCNTIKNVIPSLKCFIENAFSNVTWHFSPIQLRGVYFTAIKSDNSYSYASYSDINSSQLRYCKIPFDRQSQKYIGIKDDSVFFLEDLFRSKILKESSLIVYTDSFLLSMRILKILLLAIVCASVFLFIYCSFSSTDSLSKEIMTTKAKSWRICSNVKYWENGKFSPLILPSGDGQYSLKDSMINGQDNLAFILDFYRQNNTKIDIPAVYLMSEWVTGLNKQKNRARNTILYTSIITPLLEAFLHEYAVKVNKFDDFTAEIFANVFEYAKLLCDYNAGKESIFSYYLGSGQTSGLHLYLEDTYRYLLKNIDKNIDSKLKLLSNIQIDLQQLFDSDSLPYGINRSFTKLKNSKFMEDKEAYQNNISKLIDFCVRDYMAGPKSINLHHHQVNRLLIMEFLGDAGNYKKDEENFFQSLSIDEIIKKAQNLKRLIGMVDDIYIKMSEDKKTVVMGYSLVVREQDSIKDSHVLTFDETNFTIKFDVNEDFRDTLFFELGLKKSLCQDWFFNKLLTKEQDYLFYPFYEMFNLKSNNFLKKYAKDVDTLKSDLLYGLALKNLITLLSEYNKKSGDETINNIFNLLDNKEIKHNESIDFVIRYLVEFSIISKYIDILSKSTFPFTFKELPQNEDFVRSVDKLSNALDGLFPPDIAVREKSDTNTQPVKFQTMIRAEQNMPLFLKQWVSNAKKIISFIHINRDFVSKIYLLGQDYSKNFKQNKASDVWIAVEIEQESSDYKPIPTLARIKDNSLLGKVELTGNKPLKIKFYRTFESLANHESKEYLSVGTLPLLKFMFDNPNPAPVLNDEYSITWKAAKFDKDMGLWISKICFGYKGKKELDMYIAFTMPEGAECLKGCLESEDQKLVLKKVNENYK